MSNKKVLVGMSGGIDSAVTAYLLKEKGYDVKGAHMLIWKKDSPYPAPMSVNSCYNPSDDRTKLKALCEKIGIDLTILNCADFFESIVLKNFKDEYMNGRTPNPCVWCNAKIKFGALLDFAKASGLEFDYFATGHYARINYNEEVGRYELLKGRDLKKDQSYFLYRLTQDQLSRIIFPLGDQTKEDIRAIDVKQGYHNVDQVESQDFYSGDYSELLLLDDKEGNIVTTDGLVLGKHRGYWHYTIGQRKGLGLAAKAPLYVLEIDSVRNEVIVGYDNETSQAEVWATNVNYISRTDFEKDKLYQVKIRSASKGEPAYVENTEDGFKATFINKVKAAAKGQSMVVYDGDMVLAGGIIEKAL